MSAFLDQLARELAVPMPRRNALKVVGRAILLAVLPTATRSALAQFDACRGIPNCLPDCLNCAPWSVQAGWLCCDASLYPPGYDPFCCPPGETCCVTQMGIS